MADQRATLTKSILSDYSGYVLDIPNGKDKILERSEKLKVKLFKISQPFLKDNPNQSDPGMKTFRI